jgi:hypothetical protein
MTDKTKHVSEMTDDEYDAAKRKLLGLSPKRFSNRDRPNPKPATGTSVIKHVREMSDEEIRAARRRRGLSGY